MHDFMRFLRHLFEIIHFIRGIVMTFGMLLLLCVAVVMATEGLSIGQAIYFVLVSALTIGYGDITPVTAWGKVASVTAGMFGLLITGIIVAVAVHALGQAVQEKRRELAEKP